MVDAINKIGAQQIDWYKLTVKEVQQYQAEGIDDEIPSEVKRWVEEMAKIANAPDNVTYEMSQSGAVTAQNPQGASGVSALDEDIALAQQSDLAADEVEALMSELDSWTANAATAYSEAQSQQESLMGRINALVEQRTNAATSGDKAKVASLDEQLAAAGSSAQGVMSGFSAQISAMQSNIAGVSATAQNAISLGNQAIGLVSTDVETENAAKAAQVIEQSTNAINTASASLTITSAAELEVGTFGQNVRAYSAEIQQSTGVDAAVQEQNKQEDDIGNVDEDPNGEAQQPDEMKTAETDVSAADEKPEDDNTLSDEDITADPIEMLKRKERKGIQ